MDDVIELADGRMLRPGAIVAIRGIRGGRYVYRHRADRNSITCWGGRSGRASWRTFALDRITDITYPATTEQPSLFETDLHR